MQRVLSRREILGRGTFASETNTGLLEAVGSLTN